VVEPLLKRFGLLEKLSYNDFVAACAKDPKIDILSEANNQYRALISLILILLLLKGLFVLAVKFPGVKVVAIPALFLLLLVLLLLSYRKQNVYVVKRVKANFGGEQ
jgi:uncharacterized Tic20 family protein